MYFAAAAYAKESRIARERKTRVNLCTCGKEIDFSALLCQDCYEEIHGQSITEIDTRGETRRGK